MRRDLRLVTPAVVLALFATAVVLAGPATAHRATTGPQTYTINVDGRNAQNESFLAYFPHSITVHAGDTVVFHYVGVGEPHTVTLGTLANAAVKDYNELTPKQKESNGPPPEPLRSADAVLPSLFPQGPGDAVQSVANPCFQQSGDPGTATCPNSQHEQPAFNGTESYYNSGWLKNNERFTVHLSSSISPGTYRFMCLLHREDMAGKITVVSSTKPVMSPSAQFALGQKQLAAAEKPLAEPAALLAKGEPPIPHLTLPGAPDAVLAGSGAQNSSGSVDQFGPRVIHIPVGGSVTWWLVGDHSITFNSNSSDDDLQQIAPDGTSHINAAAIAPAGGPGEPPPAKNAPTSGLHFKIVASQTWDGKGFHNSGVFINSFGPPLIEGYKLKFTHAGTYHYICVVHDNMKGTVVVGGG